MTVLDIDFSPFVRSVVTSAGSLERCRLWRRGEPAGPRQWRSNTNMDPSDVNRCCASRLD